LFSGAASGFLRLLAPALGQARLLLGGLPLTFSLCELDTGELDFVFSICEVLARLGAFH